MAERRFRWQSSRRVSAVATALATLIFSAVGPAVPQSKAVANGSLLVPGSFDLAGSNGYEVSVAAVPARKGIAASVLVVVSGRYQGVIYTAPAAVTETSIQADLKGLGEIAVTFQRSGHPATAKCGRSEVRFDSGRYEGKVEFHGEEGYTDVMATSVPGSVDFWLASSCGGFSSGGSDGNLRARGAELHVRNPGLGPQMSVYKSRPGAAAQISASISEFNEGISIERFMRLRMASRAFTFDRRLRTAALRPPAPFAGTAGFDRDKKAGQRWSGDLTVDMPGRSDVSLTGSALRATLVPSE